MSYWSARAHDYHGTIDELMTIMVQPIGLQGLYMDERQQICLNMVASIQL